MSNKCCRGSENADTAANGGQFETAAEFFKTVSDPTRIRIFWLLCHGEECVTGLSGQLGLSSPAVSHHLRELRGCGLIASRREGKEVYYRIADCDTAAIMHEAVESIMKVACPDRASGRTNAETARAVHGYLVAHLHERITIEELAKSFHINPTTLKEAFKAEYGNSIAAHIREHRMERAAELLSEDGASVTETARRVGFVSQSRFSSAFAEKYGMNPSEYRKARQKNF